MIRLENVTKSYRLSSGRHYVFRDLSLEIPSGVNVGIMGPNGAGKSTLMRIIGRMDYPDSGRVVTDKTISWPVGLAGGIQGSLSARENVRFVCRIHGLPPHKMREVIDFVEDFAEVGEYFDMPIKTYSSGMRSRVTFGLSMAFEFDYYLVDEVTAVGDKTFKEKSQKAFNAMRGRANLIMVAHQLGNLKQNCDAGLVIRGGEVRYFDDINQAIQYYAPAQAKQLQAGAGKPAAQAAAKSAPAVPGHSGATINQEASK